MSIWLKLSEPTTAWASTRGDAAAALKVPTPLTVDLLTYSNSELSESRLDICQDVHGVGSSLCTNDGTKWSNYGTIHV